MATLKLGSTTAISESGGTVSIPSNIQFPAGHIVKINSFTDGTNVSIPANATGVEIVDFDFTALKSNSAYYISAMVASTSNDTGNTGDSGDRGFTMWLEDASAGNKYRFGYKRTSGIRHTVLASANDSYLMWDSDGGIPAGSTWNQVLYSWSFVAGNQPNYKNSTVVSSAFSAGSTITLKVNMASQNGAYYNRGQMASTNGSHSLYSIIEVQT